MSTKSLYSLWGSMFIICAGLGFIPQADGTVRIVFTVLSVLFFLPPAALLMQADRRCDRFIPALIRNLCIASLGLTLALLVLSFTSAMQAQWLGDLLHGLLVILSCPMICSGYWVLSLFLCACLLMASLNLLKKHAA